eukprot:scaffold109069_cov31-Tisochrysis_lutea.AAC.9
MSEPKTAPPTATTRPRSLTYARMGHSGCGLYLESEAIEGKHERDRGADVHVGPASNGSIQSQGNLSSSKLTCFASHREATRLG